MLSCSILFLIVQVILMLDMFSSWNDSWLNKDWIKLLMTFTIGGAVVYIAIIGITFAIYAHCTTLLILTIITVALSGLLITMTALIETASFFITSFVCVYCAYLNFTALNSNPNKECITSIFAPFFASHSKSAEVSTPRDVVMKVVSMIILYVPLIYVAFSTASKINRETEASDEEDRNSNEYRRPSSESSSTPLLSPSPGLMSANGNENVDSVSSQSRKQKDDNDNDELGDGSQKSNFQYWKLYLTFLLASGHVTSVALSYTITDSSAHSGFSAGISTASMWAKTGAHYSCVLLYIWLLLAPVVGPKLFPNRVWE
ncbi:putative Serine incorporator (Serinc) [Monocercomonoides exilis]|uniref:putative Serine incorporator (Serinc) n=1 Tax=Monocercomonoides exilis TaxID=2049356 RepID=UPI0035594A8A|nr:putative Serine incorporator (Serinc) [Monocercomonoides exilis]|eukprot:MONOS_6125.1-p1 / transcript=MONOS_6125.1 / gene=MONOS_6125 / organism=Monocercomonoides_exilis_PA203 / gene_product=unspecified product / transcript_product=unspecified product / location=Mono_scaffold00189:687-2105(-) / protein_length=315 / sequence_SO=supercontig / SO=protein_coding / is_pseudo=false